MNIEAYNHLNSNVLKELDDFTELCFTEDEDYDLYYEEESISGLDCYFIARDDNHRIIGFLSALITPDNDPNHLNIIHGSDSDILQAELTGSVAIANRGQKTFTSLVECALNHLNNNGITNIYGAIPEFSMWLKQTSLVGPLSHNEFLLINTDSDNTDYELTAGCDIISDTSADGIIYYLIKEGNEIGSLLLTDCGSYSMISAFIIKKPYRRMGYGSILLNYCLGIHYNSGDMPVILNVPSTNTAAMNLYIHNGFSVYKRSDYYFAAITSRMS